MLLPRLITPLLLAATTAQAFKNASPFFLLSSEPLKPDTPLQSTQIALAKDVEDNLIQSLEACDRKWYYIFSQDAVRAEDIRHGGMPKLQRRMSAAEKDQFVEISEVVVMEDEQAMSSARVRERLDKACMKRGKTEVGSWPESEDEYRLIELELPQVPEDPKARTKAIRDTDDAIDDTVSTILSKAPSAILIYLTTPPSLPAGSESLKAQEDDRHAYEMDDPYPSSLHTELKRDFELHGARQSDEEDAQAGLPLFEKYQFLSPPIFMGLTVTLVLLLLATVGVRAISGLDVSYAAFSKEMGPQAQKPKQG